MRPGMATEAVRVQCRIICPSQAKVKSFQTNHVHQGTREPSADEDGSTHAAQPPPRPVLRFTPEHLERFWNHIFDPEAGVAELRILNARYGYNGLVTPNLVSHSATLAGWYDSLDDLKIDLRAARWRVSLHDAQPRKRDLRARSYNRLSRNISRAGMGPTISIFQHTGD